MSIQVSRLCFGMEEKKLLISFMSAGRPGGLMITLEYY